MGLVPPGRFGSAVPAGATTAAAAAAAAAATRRRLASSSGRLPVGLCSGRSVAGGILAGVSAEAGGAAALVQTDCPALAGC